MRSNLRRYIPLLLSLLILASCERDHLYYASTEMAVVPISIDWSKTGLTPNGATVFAYREDGSLYRRFDPFSNPEEGQITLPIGHYTLVAMNDTPEEFWETLDFSGEGNINTLLAKGVKDQAKTSKLLAQTRTENMQCIVSPDTLVVARFDDLVIDDAMRDYFYERPEGNGLFNYDGVVKLTPKVVTSNTKIQVHVTGLAYAKGTTMSFLRGTSSGYYLGRDEYSSDPIAYGFILNNRKFDEGSTTNGTISANFNTFGLLPASRAADTRYYLDINFVLVNGDSYPMTFDVTDQIAINLDMEVHFKLELNLDISLPEALGGDDDSGGFRTDLSDWAEIVDNIDI